MKFRNLTISPDVPVGEWGVEGILAALERGGLNEWRRISQEVLAAPHGVAAQDLEQALAMTESQGAARLLRCFLERTRAGDKELFAREFRSLVDQLAMTHQEVADILGTSRPRVSSCCSGAVAPNAVVLWKLQNLLSDRRAQLIR